MIITSSLFEAHLKCPTKSFLRAVPETGHGNDYADWLRTQNEQYRDDGVKRLMQKYSQDKSVTGSLDTEDLKMAKWRIAINIVVRWNNLESTIHAVERIPAEGRGQAAQFIPIRFVPNNKLTKDDKLLLAFNALVLSERLGHEIVSETGKENSHPKNGGSLPKVARAEDVTLSTSRREYGPAHFIFPELKYVNERAYFDYQREKVFLRTNKTLKRLHGRKRTSRMRQLRVNRRIIIKSLRCPFCNGRAIERYPDKMHIKLAYDLLITKGGIRRQVIECATALHRCMECRRTFLPEKYKRRAKHFHALISWAMYQHVVHRVSFQRIEEMLKEFFGLHVTYTEIHMFKMLMARRYRSTVKAILANLIAGKVIHADETQANLQTEKGYVWVLASMEDVLYLYKPAREGDFLHELLKGFAGVLVTDFYSAYDSLPCEQQKCLVHLIRDMNHDLLNSPFDDAFKSVVHDFGLLLQTIVATIDKYGLKKKHLNKHMADVDRFFRMLASQPLISDLAQSYRERLEKNRDKLFTFLRHDSVPWNNNNAEHAIKNYANYRRITDGQMTASGLSDYLILLSVYQTCSYKGASFLKFLLSGEQDVDRFIELQGKIKLKSSLELYPRGVGSNHPKTGQNHKPRTKSPIDENADNGHE